MISLCTFVKNEAHCLGHMIDSVVNQVDEIIVVDTGSTDDTIPIAREYGARVYQVGFTDFASIRTITSHLAREPWVLMLDADETLEGPELLRSLSTISGRDVYAFPRKRWLDLGRTQQTELEAYPDWQVRFYRNDPNFVWRRELHEVFRGGSVTHQKEFPLIHHFHDVFKDEARKAIRLSLYRELAEKAGCEVEGGRAK